MKRLLKLTSLFLSVSLFMPAVLFARWGRGWDYGCDGWYYNRFHHGGFMGIAAIILLAIVIFFGIRMLRPGGNPFASQDPIAILKARYARGEITKEQFEQMKKDLI